MTPPPPQRAATYNRQSRGNDKSIEDQANANRAAAVDNGWTVVAEYADGTSAWIGRAARDGWQRVLAAVEARSFDVLVLWEPSRGDRDAETWLGLLRRCKASGIRIHITIEDYLYDLERDRDWRQLAEHGLDSQVESSKTSKRVRRGMASAAEAGHPSQGRTPYGYTRTRELVADPDTGKRRMVVRQNIDPTTAPIVREIFERLAKNEAVGAICTDLNARGVPTLTAQQWYRARVTDLAKNPAYIGMRRLNGKLSDGTWEPLVEAEQFYAVQRILTGPGHKRTSPGQQRHLLSYLATCAPCGGEFCAVLGRYKCLERGCVTIVQADADHLVTEAVLKRLGQPKVYERLRRASDQSDRAVLDARNEVAALEARLNDFRLSAARGGTSPESLAVIEAALSKDIQAAQGRADAASLPPALRQFLEPGADIRQRWADANIQARRAVIRAMATIRVGRATSPGSRTFEPERFGPSQWTGDTLTWGDHWDF